MIFELYLESLFGKISLLLQDEAAQPFYDLASGALVWSDEKVTGLSVQEMGCLRALFSYRTSLILNKPDERFRVLWEKANVLYPNWIGFNSVRCQAEDGLQKKYIELKRRGNKVTEKL